jgi:Hypothetical glycosyl hydrolase family 15
MMIFSSFANKRSLAAWLSILILLLVLSSCSSNQNSTQTYHVTSKYRGITLTIEPLPTATLAASVPGVRPFVDSWNNFHIFQDFDYNIQNPSAIARYYDFVWGAHPGNVQAFRSSNPNNLLSFYFSFFRDSGTFNDRGATQSLAYWQQIHPDWILYQCDRHTPAYEDGLNNVPFNFTNPAFLAWQIQTYAQPASANGFDAIAADNVNLQNVIGACGYYKNGQWVQRYTGEMDDPGWRADVLTWLSEMQQALHQLAHPLILIPNLGYGYSPSSDPQVQQVVSHLDGILDEGGFTKYGNGYLTGDAWVQAVNFIQSVQQQHKAYYIVDAFQSVDPGEIQWALASYLMAKEHSAYLTITPIQGYGSDLRYSEYNAQIGSPTGQMFLSQNIYWRDYSHGLSLVNPSPTSTYTVSLPGGRHYVDLNGNQVSQTVTLPPHSGLVLLATPS